MKKLLLVLLLLAGVVVGSRAQKIAASRKSNADEKAKTLQKQLSLTNEQTARISVIYQEAYVKFDEIKVKEHGNNDKILIASRPLVKETTTKIKSVLQPRQIIEYNEQLKKSLDNNGGWATNQGTADD